jgi:type VI secretion system VasD/TssJ family lipoprotein
MHKPVKPMLRHGVLLAAALALAGCAGGSTRKQAMAEVSWDYAKDGVMIEIAADPNLNQYAGEAHTLLLVVYQMEDQAAYYKMLADPAALARSMGSDKGGEGYLQFTRYVITPGQHSILILDRTQKAKAIGVAAGYYQLNGTTSARLFEVPLTIDSSGMLSKTWTATPATLAVRMTFGADAILNAERLNNYPNAQKIQEAVPLDGGGKEIKLTADTIKNAVQLKQTIDKLGK